MTLRRSPWTNTSHHLALLRRSGFAFPVHRLSIRPIALKAPPAPPSVSYPAPFLHIRLIRAAWQIKHAVLNPKSSRIVRRVVSEEQPLHLLLNITNRLPTPLFTAPPPALLFFSPFLPRFEDGQVGESAAFLQPVQGMGNSDMLQLRAEANDQDLIAKTP